MLTSSTYEMVASVIHDVIERYDDRVTVSPSIVSDEAFNQLNADMEVMPGVEWGAREQYKQMARAQLARKWPDLPTTADDVTIDLFAEELQDRYPVPRAPADDPIYKRRDALGYAEAIWNVQRLRKVGGALLRHADALEAWAEKHARR